MLSVTLLDHHRLSGFDLEAPVNQSNTDVLRDIEFDKKGTEYLKVAKVIVGGMRGLRDMWKTIIGPC